MTEATLTTIALTASVLLFVLMLWRTRRSVSILRVLALLIAGFVVAGSGVGYWYTHRPLPPEVADELFPGIFYVREVSSDPRPIIAHIIRIDLDTPGLSFLVTPGESSQGEAIPARTVSGFREEFGVQLAVNGDFFDVLPSNTDFVRARGLSASRGEIVTDGYVSLRAYNSLYLSADNRAAFDGPPGGTIYNAISGWQRIVVNGQYIAPRRVTDRYEFSAQPRTAYALSADARVLLIVQVDGRQPNFSEGVSLEELAEIIIRHGGYTAVNMDGGGSVTLAIEGENGETRVLNSPIHNRIPGTQRPVANHLGVYVPR